MNRNRFDRRSFLGAAAGSIGVMEWLGYFRENGVPGTPGDWDLASARAQQDAGPGGPQETRFLLYWFLEGGWDAYSMLSPVDTPNHSALSIPAGTLNPTPSWSQQIYRVGGYGTAPYVRPATSNGITHGYLASAGADLLGDMCVVSSHYGGTFHSGSRLDYHYGKYNRDLSGARGSDERSVLQAFCEARGSGMLLPHLSWHRWLSDGELALSNYPEGTGYYEKLGPPHAHTLYGRTPEDFRRRLTALGDIATTQRRSILRGYTNNLHNNFVRGRDGASVRAFSSAVQIWRSLSTGTLTVDPRTLFQEPALRQEFGVRSGDENTSETSVNGNPARGKNAPHIRVQALMAFECMRNLLGCGFWLESREVRRFDSHRSRRGVLDADTNSDQLAMMKDELWDPLRVLVRKLKETEMPGMPGRSMWAQTNIVVASEMGRSIMGDVGTILTGTGTPDEKYNAILEQDVCQHWPVSSVAFLGGNVRGGTQFGRVGTATLDAIPILPDGSLDPAFDATTGVLRPGQTQSANAFVTDAGHAYATALQLAGVNPAGRGRNTRPPLSFVARP